MYCNLWVEMCTCIYRTQTWNLYPRNSKASWGPPEYAAEFRVQFEVGELVAERDGHRELRYRNEELSLDLIVAAFKEYLEYVEYRVCVLNGELLRDRHS